MDEKKRKDTIKYAFLGAIVLGALVYFFVLPKPEDPIEKAAREAAEKAGAEGAPAGAAKAGAKGKAAAADGPTRLIKVDVNIDELLQGIQQVSFNYAEERIDRNPFEPLVDRFNEGTRALGAGGGSTIEVPKNVTGIIWDEVSPSAVVDNEVVGVGYVYPNGVKVYAIEPRQVIFLVGDSLVPVEMKEL